MDQQYQDYCFKNSEIPHHYGKNVHLLGHPQLLTFLGQLCSAKTQQPLINELIVRIYQDLLTAVINQEFSWSMESFPTRMAQSHPKEGILHCPQLRRDQKVVSVNLARAGTVPSHYCYQSLNYLLQPDLVRQDHISIARQTDQEHHVTGSEISGHKIGGPVDDSIVLIPDPMGATGGTLVKTLNMYKKLGKAKKYIAIHCIVTPEYLKRVSQDHPDLIIYSARLDRGLSSPAILQSPLGKYWDQEKGLNQQQYIVPGGGGFGEILNNAYV